MDVLNNWSKDDYLWDSFKGGDENAFEKIFKQNYKLLLNYGLKINPNIEEIKDCIQQLFSVLWESRERLGPNSSIKSYLIASLRRMIIRSAKSTNLFTGLEDIDPTFYVEKSEEYKCIAKQNEIERVQLLSETIQHLPNRQKEALYLKYYGDHSFEEISEVMGITTRAVYKLIYKALDKLSEEIGERKGKFNYLLSLCFL